MPPHHRAQQIRYAAGIACLLALIAIFAYAFHWSRHSDSTGSATAVGQSIEEQRSEAEREHDLKVRSLQVVVHSRRPRILVASEMLAPDGVARRGTPLALTTRWLRRQHVTPDVIDVHTSGRTIEEVRGGLTPKDAPADLDVAVIQLGAGNVGRTTSEDARLQYLDLARWLHRRAPKVQLLCLGAWGDPAQVDDVDHAMSAACRTAGGKFHPIRQLYNVDGNLGGKLPDGAGDDARAPSAQGYRQIADVVENSIRVAPGAD
ncbi:SGNH/GDSL hydrolase family protein [Nocardioides sp. KR10-350]|uniref:SGNH/GDSL hydrolase family protein n=1 Tax=Nocardioides cheoyonin TaxID=3156615 RepID=UPI0032B3D2FF